MTDYIKSSQVIQGFLEKEEIEIEVDEHAPVVGYCTRDEKRAHVMRQWTIDHYEGWERRCIFFGPGGADNCLKALRLFCKMRWLGAYIDPREVGGGVARWICEIPGVKREWGEGKTDGEALHDLLYKIATEEK